jgi:S1-C subfamily serine protease
MFALAATVLTLATSVPVLAPVPPEPKPDPFEKGYLGIWFTGSGPTTSLAIDRLEPDQAASKAGLRPGDVIVRVNNLQPQTTQQVIDHVCTFRPGAVIDVEVQRGMEKKAFKIKLGTRPPDAGRVLPTYPTFPQDER